MSEPEHQKEKIDTLYLERTSLRTIIATLIVLVNWAGHVNDR